MANKSNPVIAMTILLSVVAVCFSGTVQADIIYVDADAAGAGDGSSWADAYNFLQDALAAVITGDEIRIAQGIYKPDQGAAVAAGDRTATFQLVVGVTVKGGYAGFGEPNPDARDIDTYKTILSGDLAGNDGPGFANNAENSYHVVTGSGTDATGVLDGVTITAGNANGVDIYGDGSGMYNDQGSPTLKDCTFSDNWASSGGGGGMYNGNSSSPGLTDCTFIGNWPDGMDNYDSSPTLDNCTFTGNFKGMHNENSNPILDGCTFVGNDRGMYNDESSPMLSDCLFNGHDGAMYNWNGSSPSLTNCSFNGNSASSGGGMKNENANPVLTNCTFTGNSASTSGGGMYNYYSNPSLTNCTFKENSSESHSGAMRNFNSNPVLTNCTFSENSAGTDGGAIGNAQSSPNLTGCTFISNYAYNHGGGILNNTGTPVLKGCTFDDNVAFAGGAVDNLSSNAILTDCTFTLNSAVEYGAAVNNRESSPQITRCMFFRNMANDFGGGAVCNWSSNPTIRNCLFSHNYSSEHGGAVMNNKSNLVLFNCTFSQNVGAGKAVAFFSYLNDPPSTMQATNCIFFDGGNEIWKNEETDISITYSDIQGGWSGIGNIDADPMFVEVGMDDFHLLPDSPCIDAGDPDYAAIPNETDLDGNPRILDGRIDMGAYEHTAAVPIDVGITPGVVNLKSQGKFITALLTFPEGYNVADVDTTTILLQGQIQMLELVWLDEETREVMVRFSREDVQTILNPGNVELTITGSFIDDTAFKGTGIVKVINKGGKK